MSKVKWPNAKNKWGLLSCQNYEAVLTNKLLLSKVEQAIINRGALMAAFVWRSSPEGHDFWDEMYRAGTAKGSARLNQMKHELIEAKPFNKDDWL